MTQGSRIAITAKEREIKIPFVQRIINEIENNLENPNYQIEDLCERVHMSRTQLYRKLKMKTGLSFSDILINLRIAKAKSLVLYTDYNISEIAYQLGYNDPSYFVRVFRTKVGVTPGYFRNHQTDASEIKPP